MSSTIGEPFLLSSYSVPNSWKGSSSTYISYAKGPKNSDGYVTVTAQGEGVHVLDVSTLHPIVSYSQGSHTTFSAPAVTRHTLEDGDHICTTYTIVNCSPEVISKEQNRTIWITQQNLSNNSDRGEKRSIVVSHAVSRIYVLQESPCRLLLVFSNGDIDVTDAELTVQHSLESSTKQSPVETFIFPRKSCDFLPQNQAKSSEYILLSIFSTESLICVQSTAIGGDEGLARIGEIDIPLSGTMKKYDSRVIGISCTASGAITLLSGSALLSSYQLSYSNEGTLVAIPVREPIRLARLALGKNPSYQRAVSLLSLSASSVLLAALTSSAASEITLLLWDMQYGILVASQSMPVPSSLVQNHSQSPHLSLTFSNENQVLLALSPEGASGKSTSQKTSSRSTVYIVPLNASFKSSLANAMGKTSETAAWLAQPEQHPNASVQGDDGRAKLLQAMRSLTSQDESHKADEAFFKWIGDHTTGHGNKKSEPRGYPSPQLGREFVKEILHIILQPDNTASIKYSPRAVHSLLDRGVVSASMIEKGLLRALWSRNDWENILRAMNSVVDIPEGEMMLLLKAVIDFHHTSNTTESLDNNAMQVDSRQTWTPPLATYLSACITYSTSPAALRLAIREHLSDARDLVYILEILDGWMMGGTEDYIEQLLRSIAHNSRFEYRSSASPPYHKIVLFLQVLLDASFLALLQYQPSHDILRRIMSYVEPEVVLFERMEHLRGSLEQFVRIQAKSRQGSGQPEVVSDDRRRSRKSRKFAEPDIGMYRLEELVI